MINKLKSAEPIIEGYTTLAKAFKDVIDEHFDEVRFCVLVLVLLTGSFVSSVDHLLSSLFIGTDCCGVEHH